MEEHKQECSLCHELKPRNAYTHRKKECKECRNKKQRDFNKAKNTIIKIVNQEEQTQECSLCLQLKPKIEYTRRNRQCKDCRNKKRTESYEANKERILEESRQRKAKYRIEHSGKVTCECGALVCEYNLLKHKTTKKHVNKIAGIEKEKKQLITYYDEMNHLKKVFLYVEPSTYRTFKKMREQERKLTNYKILNDLKII